MSGPTFSDVVFLPLKLVCRTLMTIGHHLGFQRRDLALFAWLGVGFFALTEPGGPWHQAWNVFYIIIVASHLLHLSFNNVAMSTGPSWENPGHSIDRIIYGTIWMVCVGVTVSHWIVVSQSNQPFQPTVLDLACASIGVGLFIDRDDTDRGEPVARRAVRKLMGLVSPVPELSKVGV